MVAVWRYENSTDEYHVVVGNMTMLQLQPVGVLLATIYCMQVLLDPVNHIPIRQGDIPIRQGDIVGVVLPPINSIPIVGYYVIMTSSNNRPFPVDDGRQAV